jgi:hypothetical protein
MEKFKLGDVVYLKTDTDDTPQRYMIVEEIRTLSGALEFVVKCPECTLRVYAAEITKDRPMNYIHN